MEAQGCRIEIARGAAYAIESLGFITEVQETRFRPGWWTTGKGCIAYGDPALITRGGCSGSLWDVRAAVGCNPVS